MEKYTDTSSHDVESENASLMNNQTQRDETSKRRQSFVYLTLFNLFLFILSMLSMICAVMSQRDPSGNAAAKLMDQFEIFSPAMHQIEYSRTKFSFASPLNSSKYVGTSEEVDNAWWDIAFLPDQMVSKSDFPKLGKPADALQVTDPKTGETGYRVGLEVFHQLHCLNLLRMSTYPEHYSKAWWSDTSDDPAKVRAHLDHCIEILRVNLMCFADVNVFTFQPLEGGDHWPDYDTPHVCRNFDRIKDWAREHAMPDADV